jgi:hypothetical protein
MKGDGHIPLPACGERLGEGLFRGGDDLQIFRAARHTAAASLRRSSHHRRWRSHTARVAGRRSSLPHPTSPRVAGRGVTRSSSRSRRIWRNEPNCDPDLPQEQGYRTSRLARASGRDDELGARPVARDFGGTNPISDSERCGAGPLWLRSLSSGRRSRTRGRPVSPQRGEIFAGTRLRGERDQFTTPALIRGRAFFALVQRPG